VISISYEALSEKCLGFPIVVGRSKKGAFKNLPNRSRGKVSGCKGQGLSKAGKEVLVIGEIVHVRHSCNEAAHRLAKDSYDNKVCNSWVEVPPGNLVNLLDNDVGV
jgi:hypothetical protein